MNDTLLKHETPDQLQSEVDSSATLCSLFIGGRADGQRMCIPKDISTVQIPCNDGTCEIYKVELIRTAKKNFKICVHADLNHTEAMELLISKYPANT